MQYFITPQPNSTGLPLPFIVLMWVLVATGCTTLSNTSSLEDDEWYLKKGEAFTTDQSSYDHALELTAPELSDADPTAESSESYDDDYYDPDRTTNSGFGSGNGFGGYGNGNGYSPYGNSYGYGNGNSYDPYGNSYGYGNGYDPYGNSYGYGNGYNPYGNGYGYGNGYNPYGNSYGYGNGYNPYTYGYGSGYGYGWGNGYGSYGGGGDTYDSGSYTFGPRNPILGTSANGSNYGSNGSLLGPRMAKETPTLEVAPGLNLGQGETTGTSGTSRARSNNTTPTAGTTVVIPEPTRTRSLGQRLMDRTLSGSPTGRSQQAVPGTSERPATRPSTTRPEATRPTTTRPSNGSTTPTRNSSSGGGRRGGQGGRSGEPRQ